MRIIKASSAASEPDAAHAMRLIHRWPINLHIVRLVDSSLRLSAVMGVGLINCVMEGPAPLRGSLGQLLRLGTAVEYNWSALSVIYWRPLWSWRRAMLKGHLAFLRQLSTGNVTIPEELLPLLYMQRLCCKNNKCLTVICLPK